MACLHYQPSKINFKNKVYSRLKLINDLQSLLSTKQSLLEDLFDNDYAPKQSRVSRNLAQSLDFASTIRDQSTRAEQRTLSPLHPQTKYNSEDHNSEVSAVHNTN